ncbi:MAG TPA: phosphomannomutase [Desulfobacteraceae bacterium]|nr:phosphomannomutase [Desulfobacteraceae bacterium]
MTEPLRCVTAYDIRGKVPDELDELLARRIGLAFVDQFALRKVVIGRDVRPSSPGIAAGLAQTLTACGVDVVDIGLAGTEEVYHAVFSGIGDGVEGGIMVTASHNPAEYNGMKLVERGARPVSSDSGLTDIARKAASDDWWRRKLLDAGDAPGRLEARDSKDKYVDRLLSFAGSDRFAPLKLVVNAGNGCAGPVVDLLETRLPFTFVKLHHQPDGTFPNGVPNPLLRENRAATAEAVVAHRADMGIAWDGDFDRCFFFDETGRFIQGYYIVGLLAAAALRDHPGGRILHDPRLIWNTVDMVTAAGGRPVMTRTGHAFIKQKMREVDAVYGGEMSAHHYFRDFGYCDSGMIPWLLVCRLLSDSGRPLSAMVADRMAAYPVSGEINSIVADPDQVIDKVKEHYSSGDIDLTDGLSVAYPAFRFNLRKSNTEPVLRLNVETRGDRRLLERKTRELLDLIGGGEKGGSHP